MRHSLVKEVHHGRDLRGECVERVPKLSSGWAGSERECLGRTHYEVLRTEHHDISRPPEHELR